MKHNVTQYEPLSSLDTAASISMEEVDAVLSCKLDMWSVTGGEIGEITYYSDRDSMNEILSNVESGEIKHTNSFLK